MTNRNSRMVGRLSRRGVRLIIGLGLAAVMTILISCTTVHRSVVELPLVPGANFIGSKECEQCHDKIYRDFISTADHARLITPGPNSIEVGCESCHGPASLHAQSGGEVKPPYGYAVGRPVAGGHGLSLAVPPARSRDSACLQCHADIRAQFNLPSHHPLPEAKMGCIDCHPPHKGSAHKGGGTAVLDANEACFQCHAAQRGPHAFEHEALREGCATCHTPHGSINAKLLTTRNANLCVKCHFQRASGGSIFFGGSDHTLRVQQGTCWTSGCHEAVHGSRVDSSLRF